MAHLEIKTSNNSCRPLAVAESKQITKHNYKQEHQTNESAAVAASRKTSKPLQTTKNTINNIKQQHISRTQIRSCSHFSICVRSVGKVIVAACLSASPCRGLHNKKKDLFWRPRQRPTYLFGDLNLFDIVFMFINLYGARGGGRPTSEQLQ